jgi:hypothetical protein
VTARRIQFSGRSRPGEEAGDQAGSEARNLADAETGRAVTRGDAETRPPPAPSSADHDLRGFS